MEEIEKKQKQVREMAEEYLRKLLMGMENNEYDFGNVKVAYNVASASFVHVAHKLKYRLGEIYVYYTNNEMCEDFEKISRVKYTEQVMEMIYIIEL